MEPTMKLGLLEVLRSNSEDELEKIDRRVLRREPNT